MGRALRLLLPPAYASKLVSDRRHQCAMAESGITNLLGSSSDEEVLGTHHPSGDPNPASAGNGEAKAKRKKKIVLGSICAVVLLSALILLGTLLPRRNRISKQQKAADQSPPDEVSPPGPADPQADPSVPVPVPVVQSTNEPSTSYLPRPTDPHPETSAPIPVTEITSEPSTSSPTSQCPDGGKEQIVCFLARIGEDYSFLSGSPEDLAAKWITETDMHHATSNLVQRYAMALIYFQLASAYQSVPFLSAGEGGWLSGDDECEWLLVTCDEESGAIVEFQFFNYAPAFPNGEQNVQVGQLPSALGLLTDLTELYITGGFTGPIPESIFRLSLLNVLYVVVAPGLTGPLSTSVGLLTSLKDLYIFIAPGLAGPLPTDIGLLTDLRSLQVEHVGLTGAIPAEIESCASLWEISLSNNNLSGPIPSGIWKFPGLFRFKIANNARITGNFPEDAYRRTNLQMLDFARTSIQGTIGTEVGLLSDMQDFALDGSDMYGSLPSELGTLTKMIRLSTASLPGISGTIPESLFANRQLGVLNVSETSLTGTLPTKIGMASSLGDVDVSHTRLSGTVPSEIGRLSYLTSLNFANTSLVGSIPDPRLCRGFLRAIADCLPLEEEDPPMPCACCAVCCDRDTGECEEN